MFCAEAASLLPHRAHIALNAEYRKVFQQADFDSDDNTTLYDAVRLTHVRQAASQDESSLKRDASFSAVFGISSLNMLHWITVLEKLQLAQQHCATPLTPLLPFIRDSMARFVRKYHPHYAALEIWTSPVTDVQAIINWLHGVCPAPQQLNRCRPHHNNPIYCQRCRTKHTWNQHVPPPPPYKRDGQQYKGRAIQRPKASGVAAPTTSESDDGMCGPLVYDTGATDSHL